MAPAEIVPIPRGFESLKVLDKAMKLPLIISVCSEVSRLASPITPYVESSLNKAIPLVEGGYRTIKIQVDDKVVPYIPNTVSECVNTKVTATKENVTAAVEKVDGLVCSGIDLVTEKVTKLKEASSNLVTDTKVDIFRMLRLELYFVMRSLSLPT